MGRLDYKAVAASLDPSRDVPAWLPDGKRNGHEWVARNPTRGDARPGSFSINMTTGAWADFATDDRGGDLLSLYAYLFHGGDVHVAATKLADDRGIQREARPAPANVSDIEDAKPEIVMPVPDEAPEVTFDHYRHGQPSLIFPYYDRAGRLLMYVCRFDPPGQRKQILPRTLARHLDGSLAWQWAGPKGKDRRPLYGLDRLAARPDVDVILVEGEKAADAGEEIFGDDAAVMAWLGGTGTVDKVQLRELRGRTVYLWPDADAQTGKDDGELLPIHEQPGMKAMLTLARRLSDVAAKVLMIGYRVGEQESGWDLADAVASGWSLKDVMDYVAANTGDPWRIAAGEETPPPAPEPEPEPAPTKTKAGREHTPTQYDLNPYGFPHMTEKGQPLSTLENVSHMLTEYGITTRYNEVAKRAEISVPGREYSRDNADNCALAEITSLAVRNRVPKGDLPMYLAAIADRHAYNPVADWIYSRPWDGTDRIGSLCDTLEVADDTVAHLRDVLVCRWMISAVAAVRRPGGVQAHGVLVLQGAQGAGKTSWMRRLAPPELHATLDGAMIDPANKDTLILALSHWVVELGELDGVFRKADIARLKAFVTMGQDKLRQPYARAVSEYPRRTVFFASVNESRYLVDDTGNRRWWTIPVKSVNYEHDIDMQQVWAQVAELYDAGEQWWLTREEQALLAGANESHESVDPMKERLLAHYNWEFPNMGPERSATEVLLELAYREPSRAEATHMAKLLAEMPATPRKRGGSTLYRVPMRAETK